jgi:hypothetical protein
VATEAFKRYTFEQVGYAPHSQEQWNCHLSTAQVKALCCGRRWGKTTFGGNELTVAALDIEKPEAIYWIVAPTYPLGEKEFRVVHHNLVNKLKMGHRIKRQYNVNQGNMRIEMPWGTVIEVKTADRKEGLLGEGLDGVIMAEAAQHGVDTWETYIQPALTDKNGWAIFSTTPRGYNWFHGLWSLGTLPDFTDYESWRLPTWSNATVYPDGLLDKRLQNVKRTVSEVKWLQEYAAEFVAYEGKIYTEFNPVIHVGDYRFNPVWRNYLCFDYGFADPFCCYDLAIDAEDNVFIWREYQVSGMTTLEHGRTLANRTNPPAYHIDGMFGDPRGADAEATIGLVLGAVYSEDVAWELGIEAIKQCMKIRPDGSSRFHVDQSCTELIRQLERLHYVKPKDGHNARNIQHDYDDHGPDAIRYGFNHLFVLGVGPRLSDIYTPGHSRSESYAFFTKHTKITR